MSEVIPKTIHEDGRAPARYPVCMDDADTSAFKGLAVVGGAALASGFIFQAAANALAVWIRSNRDLAHRSTTPVNKNRQSARGAAVRTYLQEAENDLRRELVDEEAKLPSDEAFRGCMYLIQSLVPVLVGRPDLPLPDLTSTGEGDLDAHWRQGAREVILAASPAGFIRLQRLEFGGSKPVVSETFPAPSAAALLESLDWLVRTKR